MKVLLMEATFDPRLIRQSLPNYLASIQGEDIQLYLFTSSQCYSLIPENIRNQLAGVKIFDNYYQSPEVEWEALKLYQTFPYERLVALREFDLLRAARLREQFALPGQPYAVSLTFRDKYIMKHQAKQAGFPTPEFSAVDNASELYRFAHQQKFPIIVKPRLKAGGLGFTILQNESDIANYLNALTSFVIA